MGSETIKIIKQLFCGFIALFPCIFNKMLFPSVRSLTITLST